MNEETEERFIQNFNIRYSGHSEDCLLVRRLRTINLTGAQIASILYDVVDTCNNCWDALYDCKCSEEEIVLEDIFADIDMDVDKTIR